MDYEEQMSYDYNKERIDNQYFIDLRGKVHKYKGDMCEEVCSMHYVIARDLYPKIDNAVDYLIDLGWVLVGSSCYHTPIIKKKPTQAQINTLDDLELLNSTCIEEGGYYVKLKNSKLWN
jgi:hypothetical protein